MLDVLIIGCGNIAGRFDELRDREALPLTHAGAYRRHPGFRLAACVDPDETRLDAFSEHWQVGVKASKIEDLRHQSGDFDVISICSPTEFHVHHLEAALALKPKLVFAEKPLTTNTLETGRWVNRFEQNGIALAVNYTRRWQPDIIALAANLRSGQYGAIRSASGVYNKGIANSGSHMLDLLRNLLGEISLVAVGSPSWDFWEHDPSIPAMLRSESGVPIILNIGDARDYSLFELRIVTESGTIEMTDGGMNWVWRSARDSVQFPGYKSLGESRASEGDYSKAMLGAVSNIAEHIEGGESLACDGQTALAAQIICDQIYAAAVK